MNNILNYMDYRWLGAGVRVLTGNNNAFQRATPYYYNSLTDENEQHTHTHAPILCVRASIIY